ncbi:MAG: N-acetylneuraminate synthase [Candidatus Omnitrophica bacterium]|nr:N-acetylneuraminate synthase [Candidatus Omnitrophota bacterium]MBU3929175.1 N-acetylneuraminate synthase [bacterium]
MKIKKIRIKDREVGDGCPAFIIAEAGVNHNGSLKLANKLVEAAKAAGADAVKFQTFKTEELVTRRAPQAEYQKKNAKAKSQFEMLRKLELLESEFREIFKYCRKKKIIFLSTPFDQKSAQFLNGLGVPAFKIGSGDITNIPLLKTVAGFGKPVILSSGMSTMAEVEDAVKTIYNSGNRKLILLHCTSNYPADMNDVNLRAMNTLRDKFKVPIGYSDHTKGIEMSLAAVAMGACVIEKHFTLSKKMKGPDHKASIEQREFSKLVQNTRMIEKAFGNGIKKPAFSEKRIMDIARKSVVSTRKIKKGEQITLAMLTVKRPGTGIKPKDMNKVLGKKAAKIIGKNEILLWKYLK